MEISIKWNICRVCLQEEPDSKGGGHMRYIFGDNSEELAQEIYECTGITMRPDDNLPQKICRRCFNILRSTVYFRKTCRESDKYLQSVIQRTKSASTLFKLDRKDNSRCKFLDKNAEDFYYFENNAEDDTIDDIGAESSIREDAIKRKPRFGRFIRKKMRSLDMPTSSTLITIKEHEYQIPDSGGYEEETNDMGLMDIIEKGDDEKYMDNEEHYVSHDNEEEDAVKSGEEIIGETYERVEPDAIETREEYEGDEHNNNSNENYTDNCHDNNSIALKTSNFAKLHNIVTKLPTPEENDGKNGTIDEVEVNDDNAGETNFESDIVVKREEIYILLNESDDQTEVRASIDNQDHPNVEYVSGEEDDLDLETLDDLESAQVTSTVRGNGEVKSDEHDIEESPSNLSYPDAQPPQNPGFVVTEYIIPDVTESQVKKEDAAVGKGKITFVKARSTRVKKDGTINNNFAAVTTINCNVCGNMFTSRHLLNAHMRIHRQEKPHECELCFKRFITACNLQAHMRIHTGEKPFECQFCGRRFTDRSTHIRHERVHTNEKPFTCEYCSKSFALSTTLQAHIKVHTGERPYKCGPCSKSFKLPHQLKAHQNTHLHKAVEQSTM